MNYTEKPEQNVEDGEKISRPEAIRQLEKFAAYTAPGLLVMLTGTAYAQSDSANPV
jgi:hypothetical protein